MDCSLSYYSEINDFICAETLQKIDYGILDMSKIRDCELMDELVLCVELLEVELRLNYKINGTGIFRVHMSNDKYYYEEFGEIIEADSICELRNLVLEDSRIWYVFDEFQAKTLR